MGRNSIFTNLFSHWLLYIHIYCIYSLHSVCTIQNMCMLLLHYSLLPTLRTILYHTAPDWQAFKLLKFVVNTASDMFSKLWNEFTAHDHKSTVSKNIFYISLKEYLLNRLDENFICTQSLCLYCHL